jgi:hypothetical protein
MELAVLSRTPAVQSSAERTTPGTRRAHPAQSELDRRLFASTSTSSHAGTATPPRSVICAITRSMMWSLVGAGQIHTNHLPPVRFLSACADSSPERLRCAQSSLPSLLETNRPGRGQTSRPDLADAPPSSQSPARAAAAPVGLSVASSGAGHHLPL